MGRGLAWAWAAVAGLCLGLACGADEVSREADAPAAAPLVPAAQTAAGSVRGRSFAASDASIRRGVLTLRQGEGPLPALEVSVLLPLRDDTVVPEGRTWNVECSGEPRGRTPQLHVAFRSDATAGAPTRESARCGYRMRLELGSEDADGALPGRIALDAPGLATRVSGTFRARIEGYRVKNGEVDVTKDDVQVLRHVAAVWLAEATLAPVEILDDTLAWVQMRAPESGAQSGYGVYFWAPALGGDPRIAKLQFEKRAGVWQVARPLEPWQVAEAHPLSAPTDLAGELSRRAAQRFEEEHRAAHGDAPVFVRDVRSAFDAERGVAEATVRFVLDPARALALDDLGAEGALVAGAPPGAGEARGADPPGGAEGTLVVRYLFRADAAASGRRETEAWRLERRLDDGEVVDWKRGRVGRRGERRS